MNESSVENLNTALKSLRSLRHSFVNYLNALTDATKSGPDEENEPSAQKSFDEFKTNRR